MNIVPTVNRDNTELYIATNAIELEKYMPCNILVYKQNGLNKKYDCGEYNNNKDNLNDNTLPYGYNYSGNCGTREFSTDNQEILKKYLIHTMAKKDKINIVEIGVCRNILNESSTSVFIQNKRHGDIYLGIDVIDHSELNNDSENIFTIKSPSENIEYVFGILKDRGINEIDFLMIDGLHSINQCYTEWENYTQILSSIGCVVMHDTNCHPGPYFLVKSIDTDMYDVYKYLTDVQDWGISVALLKDN
jgi:hypothetical protein